MVWIEEQCHFRFGPPGPVRWPPACAEKKFSRLQNFVQINGPQWICIGPWSLIHFSYHACRLFLVWPKLNFLSWSDAHESFGVEWIVWFIVGSICKQFCSCWCHVMCLHHSNLILIDSLTFLFSVVSFEVRSVRMLNTIVCSGPSVWQYSIQ
jgi:hypothetical protein